MFVVHHITQLIGEHGGAPDFKRGGIAMMVSVDPMRGGAALDKITQLRGKSAVDFAVLVLFRIVHQRGHMVRDYDAGIACGFFQRGF